MEVLDAGETPTGTRVGLEGTEPGTPPGEIDIDTFGAIPLTLQQYTVVSGGKALLLNGKPLRTNVLVSGEVH